MASYPRKVNAGHFFHFRSCGTPFLTAAAGEERSLAVWPSAPLCRPRAARPDLRYLRKWDRCRYYWQDAGVENEVQQLIKNLTGARLPPGLVSQYLPKEYHRLRSGEVEARPTSLIQSHIREVLVAYTTACGFS